MVFENRARAMAATEKSRFVRTQTVVFGKWMNNIATVHPRVERERVGDKGRFRERRVRVKWRKK